MASGERDMTSVDAGVTTQMTETNEADEATKLSPWMIAKVHHKVTAGKKHTSKTSKRGAGGGKAKKKGLNKARIDGVEGASEVDSSSQPVTLSAADGEADLSKNDPLSLLAGNKAAKPPVDTAEQTDTEREAAQKTSDLLAENLSR